MHLHFIHIHYTWLENVVIHFQQGYFACNCHPWPELFMCGNKNTKTKERQDKQKKTRTCALPSFIACVFFSTCQDEEETLSHVPANLQNAVEFTESGSNCGILRVMRWLKLTNIGSVSESQSMKYRSMPSHIRNKLLRTNWKYTTSRTLAGKGVTVSSLLFWCKPWNGWSLWELEACYWHLLMKREKSSSGWPESTMYPDG